MKKFKDYLKQFAEDTEGSQLVEFIITLAIVAVIAGFVFLLLPTLQHKTEQVNDMIEGINPAGSISPSSGAGTGGSSGGIIS